MATFQNAADIPITEEMNNLYHQVDGSVTSLGILGLSSSVSWTIADYRITYRALALRLHPDKCHPSQAELHTRLFVKVQSAYEDLCKQGTYRSNDVQDRQSRSWTPRPFAAAPNPDMPRAHRKSKSEELTKLEQGQSVEPKPSRGSSKPRNNKAKRDERHSGKGMKAEARYQKAWQEERERRWRREAEFKHSQAAAGSQVARSKDTRR